VWNSPLWSLSVAKGMIQFIDIQHGPEQGVEKKKNGERILGDLDHQRNKNKSLRETLSTSFYSPSPVKEDQRLTKRFRMTLLNIVGQSLWYGMIIHIPKRSRTDLWIRSDATFQKYYIHLHHLKREFCFEKTFNERKSESTPFLYLIPEPSPSSSLFLQLSSNMLTDTLERISFWACSIRS